MEREGKFASENLEVAFNEKKHERET